MTSNDKRHIFICLVDEINFKQYEIILSNLPTIVTSMGAQNPVRLDWQPLFSRVTLDLAYFILLSFIFSCFLLQFFLKKFSAIVFIFYLYFSTNFLNFFFKNSSHIKSSVPYSSLHTSPCYVF